MNGRRLPTGFVFSAIALSCVLLVGGLVGDAAGQPKPASPAKPEGEMRWACT